ncbi:MAG: AMP-binding protein [Candidatus Gastranaerophilales bacterium]|nr:AMP-binding protein [Candidatus Gastranaerophilales bacterium]
MSAILLEKSEKNYIKYKFKGFQSICDYLEDAANRNAMMPAITDKYNNIEQNYAEYILQSKDFASGLQSLGIRKDDTIGLFSENNGRWIVVDQGILRCGARDAVRGSNAPVDELDYIIGQSDSCALVLQNSMLFDKLKPYLPKYDLNFIVIMFHDAKYKYEDVNCPVYTFDDILAMGKKHCYAHVDITPYDIASILYTSGTTGNPKGVMLTHGNFLYQFETLHKCILCTSGETILAILPIWHAYERVGTYYFYGRGCHICYTTLSKIKDDMIAFAPSMMMSVPRIWEAVRTGIYAKLKQKSPMLYNVFDKAVKFSMAYKSHSMYVEQRITDQKKYNPLAMVYHAGMGLVMKPLHEFFKRTLYKKLKDMAGLNFRLSISGGGALSSLDERFYDAIGVNLRVGYGLTETSPVLTLRSLNIKNFLGSAGIPITGTDIRIVNPETKEELPFFEKGLVIARGPQIMKGYYKDENATRAVLDSNGWFNTGDLGYMTNTHNLVLQGRMKETIVLSNGENVEPIPIEDACLASPYINQIVLVGQDQGAIGALVVPTKEALEKCGIDTRGLRMQKDVCVKNPALRKLIKSEIDTYIKTKSKLKPFEKIMKFEILKDGFSIDNGLMTSTAKIKRNKVFETYNDVITGMYQ